MNNDYGIVTEYGNIPQESLAAHEGVKLEQDKENPNLYHFPELIESK